MRFTCVCPAVRGRLGLKQSRPSHASNPPARALLIPAHRRPSGPRRLASSRPVVWLAAASSAAATHDDIVFRETAIYSAGCVAVFILVGSHATWRSTTTNNCMDAVKATRYHNRTDRMQFPRPAVRALLWQCARIRERGRRPDNPAGRPMRRRMLR